MPLRRSADFHLASGISSLVSLPLKPPERRPTPAGKQAQPDKPKRREGVFFGTLEGGLGAVLPVDEQVFQRLSSLQLVLVNALPHAAALNPRSHRRVKRRNMADVTTLVPRRNMLDGTLIWRFASLDARDQHLLATAIGTTAEKVLESLGAIDASAQVFGALSD
mmetsp:Transcript_43293/g.97834  ORF Transcript_43293/g.97834 Transcript_43293/m.97834 type:complete len:164 (+) Transcript_43293:82-573(+)